MELEKAVSLVTNGIDASIPTQLWVDLGAGGGLFSEALSTLLPANSTIYAMDKAYSRKPTIHSHQPSVTIITKEKDFSKEDIGLTDCDGILLANSLHYIQDKPALLLQLKRRLKPAGRIIIVEYDTNRSNQWVPYPVSYIELQKLCVAHHLGSLQKLAEQPSVFRTGGIYAALLSLE